MKGNTSLSSFKERDCSVSLIHENKKVMTWLIEC